MECVHHVEVLWEKTAVHGKDFFSFGSVLWCFCNRAEVQLSCLRAFSVGWHLGVLQSGLSLPLDCSVAIT